MLLDNLLQDLLVEPEQARGGAERDHVGAPAGIGFRELCKRQVDDPRPRRRESCGRRPGTWVTDNEAAGSERNFGFEALRADPVNAHQQIDLVGETLDGPRCEAQQGCRLAAADLRSH